MRVGGREGERGRGEGGKGSGTEREEGGKGRERERGGKGGGGESEEGVISPLLQYCPICVCPIKSQNVGHVTNPLTCPSPLQ